MSYNSWHPNTKIGYDSHWENVKKLSSDDNVKNGLWAAVRYITQEEMLTNQKDLNVAPWKFDFDKLEDRDFFDNRIKGVRDFIKKTNCTTQTSWCPGYDDIALRLVQCGP